jgi:putative MATE family efflux protein
MRLLFMGWFFYSVWLMAFSVMQAAGDATTPLVIHACTRAVQMVLSPLLVFGVWVFPELGVSGAAVSIAVTQAGAMLASLWVLTRGTCPVHLSFRGFRVQPALIWRMVRIGLPAVVMGTQANLAQTVLMRLLAPFGTVAVAAHTLNQRVDMLVSLPGMGIGMGAGVLVGHNLGAHRPQRAQHTGWIAAGLIECFMGACAVAALVFAEAVMHVFTSDGALIATASGFLRIAAAGYLFNGLSSALQNSISGSGDTLLPMIVSLTSTWAVLIPLASSLPRVGNLDAYGIRWAMVASLFTSAVAYAVYFRLGRWKQKAI